MAGTRVVGISRSCRAVFTMQLLWHMFLQTPVGADEPLCCAAASIVARWTSRRRPSILGVSSYSGV